MKQTRIVIALVAIAGLSLLAYVWPGQAAPTENVMAVTIVNDDVWPDGFCSLREALHNANNNMQMFNGAGECPAGSASEADVIRLSSGQTYALTLVGNSDDQGDLDVLANGLPLDLRLEPDGATATTIQMTVNGERVMEIHGASVELHNLIMTGGAIDGPGGGILNDGGNLALAGMEVRNNTATAGGGLYNDGTAAITDSQIALNNGTFVGGGGIYSSDNLTITNSIIRANEASSGGGIYQAGGVLVVQNGSSVNLNSVSNNGGGFYLTNDIVSATIQSSVVEGNQADNDGGGLYFASLAYDKLLVTDGRITNNMAGVNGGGTWGTGRLARMQVNENRAANIGGGLYTHGTLQLEDVRVHNNTAVFGGGLAGATVQATGLRVYDNEADQRGGGMYVSMVNLKDSEIVKNNAGVVGGGLYADASILFPLTAVLERVLVAENIAADGGGIWTERHLEMGNVTISDNAALADGAGLYIAPSGIVTATNITLAMNTPGVNLYKMGQLTLQNSIISNGAQTNCITSLDFPEINSWGNNLSDDDSCLGLDEPTDIINLNTLLGPLADNGGNTRTRALLDGSPAIDAANAAACAAPPVNGVDQRGMLRPLGSGCDMGAFEKGMAIFLPFIQR